MEDLCQHSSYGRGGPNALIAIQATTYGLKNDMIQQFQNSCPFFADGDMPDKHLDKFLHVTQSKKVNGVPPMTPYYRLSTLPLLLEDRADEWCLIRLPKEF
ncbi:hypothetical protein Tco_1223553 [Tanacetum coccineum]